MVHKWFFILLFTSINSHIFGIQQLSLESNVVISVFFTKILQLGAWLFLVWFLVGSDWLIKSFSRCALTLMSTRKWSWFFTLWLVSGCLFLVCSLMRTKLDSPFFQAFQSFPPLLSGAQQLLASLMRDLRTQSPSIFTREFYLFNLY